MGANIVWIWVLIAASMEWVRSSTEYIFQFDLKNAKDWDDYQVIHSDDAVHGTSHKCTPRLPKIFKRLCVGFDDAQGFKLHFQKAANADAPHDGSYSDLLWYYGDHKSAQTAENVAKAKYVDFDTRELTEIAPSLETRRGLLSLAQKSKLGQLLQARKCFTYGGAEACAHVDPSNSHLMTVSVGLDEDDDEEAESDDTFGAADEDVDDMDDEYMDDEYMDKEAESEVFRDDTFGAAALLEDDDMDDEYVDEDELDDLLYVDDEDMDDIDELDAYYADDDFIDDDDDDEDYFGEDYEDAYGDYDLDDISDLYKNFLAAKRSMYPQQNIPSADMISAALQEMQNAYNYDAYDDDDYDDAYDYDAYQDGDDAGAISAYANAFEDDYGDVSIYDEEYAVDDQDYEEQYFAAEMAQLLARAEQEDAEDEQSAAIVDDENGDHFFEEDDAAIMGQQKPFVANAVRAQSNAYDAYAYEYEEGDAENDDENALEGRLERFKDGEAWTISSEAVDDYDEEWDNDEEWEENNAFVTVHGHQITRKCMHMWGHRLCLCQFLNWIDGRKYKCLPSAGFHGFGGSDDGGVGGGGAGGYMGGDGGGVGGNMGVLPNHQLNAAGTYSTYHSYGSPGITHHEVVQHDPDKVKYETVHLVPDQQKQTQIEHEIHFHVKSNIQHSDADQDAEDEYYQGQEAISNVYALGDQQQQLDVDDYFDSAYDEDDAAENEDDAYESQGDAGENYGFDAFYEDAGDDLNADRDASQGVDDYDYGYDRESISDQSFSHYFGGNSNMEQQNVGLQPGIFWTMDAFAVLCGVVFCFCAVCYCCKKRQKRYSFARLENKMTDFDESATEYSFVSRDVRKPVRKAPPKSRRPARVAQPADPELPSMQSMHDAQPEDDAAESQSANESSASSNDEYNESDEERFSKKHRDIVIQEYEP